jgi:hypothetical protein
MPVNTFAYGTQGRLVDSNKTLLYGVQGRLLYDVEIITRPRVPGGSTPSGGGGLRKQKLQVPAKDFNRDQLIAQMVREDEELVAIVVSLIESGDIK